MTLVYSFIGIIIAMIIAVVLALRMPIKQTPGDFAGNLFSDAVVVSVITVRTFPDALLEKYVGRMIEEQPFSNDRILEGSGKDHTLSALATTVSSDHCAILSVQQQIGDTFS